MYFLIGMITLLVVWIAWVKSQREELEKHHLITYGRIVDCSLGGKSGAFYVEYEFFLNKKLYKSSSGLKCRNFRTSVIIFK